MSNHARLETSDFIFHGEDLLSGNTTVPVIDGEKSQVVSKGDSSIFFGMDKFIVAFMLKQGVHEVELTQSDMDKVESFSIDWRDGNSKVVLSANHLPLKGGKDVVPIVVYSPKYPFDKDCDQFWDFYTPKLAGKGIVYILLTPESLEGDEKIIYINRALKMYKSISENTRLEYKPFNPAEIENTLNKVSGSSQNKSGFIRNIFRFLGR
ncbi:hypothetical protein [Pseudoalteromonas sp. MEBiC 03485]|uniref:hypothetical protein n=1 Tax=Pseudoalteromonas sp. MEBiC 03485 TaxID=2571103 RepID=UPI001020E657|nr:hypothetical protein [Pseudoalteromonas sp. MEBiC 03485]RZD19668.1 hypothetical protein EVU92_20930 [Pseudoalteromonas sp. MEBiC 03485]